MTISTWLNVSLNFMIKLAQSDMFQFIILGIAILSLYGVISIVLQLCYFYKR